MYIPIHISVRGVTIVAAILAFLSFLLVRENSQAKHEYQTSEGKVVYFDSKYQDLPKRHIGDFRYLIIDSYPYPFEIYEPNSEPTENTIDEFKVGDLIEVFYFERKNTHVIGLNRFAQFIDKGGKPYFVRNSFQKSLGYALLGMCGLIISGALIAWKFKKLKW